MTSVAAARSVRSDDDAACCDDDTGACCDDDEIGLGPLRQASLSIMRLALEVRDADGEQQLELLEGLRIRSSSGLSVAETRASTNKRRCAELVVMIS